MMDVIDFGALIAYPAMPAEARVALMVAKYAPIYGIVPLVIPSILIDVPLPNDTIPQQSGTDLAYINTLAERVGYTFYLQPGPLPGMSIAYWGPKLQMAIPFLTNPPPLAIDWDGRSNVESLSVLVRRLQEDAVRGPGQDRRRPDPASRSRSPT